MKKKELEIARLGLSMAKKTLYPYVDVLASVTLNSDEPSDFLKTS